LAADGADLGGDLPDPGGLVAFAAVGDGGEEGGIGLDEEAIGGDGGGDGAKVGGLGEGDVAGEGNHEADVEGAAGVVGGSGEAVEDSAKIVGSPMLLKLGEGVIPCVGRVLRGAAVDEDGKPGGGGDFHLGGKGLALFLARGVVVVVVEADFADGDDVGVVAEGFEFFEGVGSGEAGFVGMDSGGGIDAGDVGAAGVVVGEFGGAVHGVGAVADADGEDGFDSGGVGTLEHRLAVAVVAVAVEVSVGVDEHGAASYLRRAPSSTSSRKLARTGLPPSRDAARSMPLDSRPRILRGARLATMTTLRPMRDSGE
jgi:hypothetical protein